MAATQIPSRPTTARPPLRRKPAMPPTTPFDARPGAPPPQRAALQRFVWRALWSPFWVGSDLHAPPLPRRGMADERITHLRKGLEATRFVQWMLEIQDRVWRQRLWLISLRAFWLLCIVEIAICTRGVLVGRVPGVGWLVAPMVVVIVLASVYTWLQRPTRMGIARFLDGGYGLDAHLATSLELARGELDSALAPRILNQAAGTAYRIGRSNKLRLHRLDREQVLALGLVIILAGTALLLLITPAAGRRAFVPVPRPAELPQVVNGNPLDPTTQPSIADQQLTPEQVQQLAVQSAQAQQDLRSLANSLNDNSTTKQTAQDLQNGDTAKAAQDLQQVASSVDQLSPDAKQQLAQDLQNAANQNSQPNSDLAQAEQQAATALQQPNGSAAAQAQSLRDLSGQVQQTGTQVRSQQDLSNALQDANQRANGDQAGGQPNGQGQPQPGDGQPNGMNGPGAGLGQPVPYQAGDPTQVQDAGSQGRPVTLTGQSNGQGKPLPGGQGAPPTMPNNNSNGGAASAPMNGQQGQVGAASPDSNRVPTNRRDIVGSYFTPPGTGK